MNFIFIFARSSERVGFEKQWAWTNSLKFEATKCTKKIPHDIVKQKKEKSMINATM